MDYATILIFALCAYFPLAFRIVRQQQHAIVETLGKYSKTLKPGPNLIFFPFQMIVGRVSLKISSAVNTEVSIKTTDDMFVTLPVEIMISVDNAQAAYYQLKTPEKQLAAWVLNTVRSTTASMTIKEVFGDRTQIVSEVERALQEKLSSFGYRIDAVLIDQPAISPEAQAAFNSVVTAERRRDAARMEAEAEQIRTVTQAQAEADAQETRARGLATARNILAQGLATSLSSVPDLRPDLAAVLLLETNRIDALREIGGDGNLILMDLNTNTGHQALLPLLQDVVRKNRDTGGIPPA